jgi:hypothetical protein
MMRRGTFYWGTFFRGASLLVIALGLLGLLAAGSGCGAKKEKRLPPAGSAAGQNARESSGTLNPEPGASPDSRDRRGAGTYSWDQAAEYVRDVQERLKKIDKDLDESERLIGATEVPETAEMEARLVVLRALSEDIGARALEAENNSTRADWPAWQQSIDEGMANLARATARLDSMVAAVRKAP